MPEAVFAVSITAENVDCVSNTPRILFRIPYLVIIPLLPQCPLNGFDSPTNLGIKLRD